MITRGGILLFMTRCFHPVERDQQLLLPPDLHDWLDPGDLAYFIIDAVDEMNLTAFFRKYKPGSGQKAYSPEMMVPLLLFAYCQGVRSSRQIEKLCARDVGFRIVACNTFPDYSTIARFRSEFDNELKDLFTQALVLCSQAGLVKLGSIAIDGTKIKANAAMEANKTREKLAMQVELLLAEAQKVDEAEDAQFGHDKRGDELPEQMRSPASRRAALRAAKQRKDRLERAYQKADEKAREQIRAYDEKVAKQAERQPDTGGKGRPGKLKFPSDEDLDKPKANTTDPDSELVKSRTGFVQGFNAQAAVTTETQIIVAAYIAPNTCDMKELHPMILEVERSLEKAAITEPVGAILADAGYWCHEAMEAAHNHFEKQDPTTRTKLYVAVPERYSKVKSPPEPEERLPEGASLIHRLEFEQRSVQGQKIYKQRAQSIEPAFGQIKSVRNCDRFMQRGHAKVATEWNLMCTTHNLLKLYRHRCAQLN